MLKIGNMNKLKVLRETDIGYMLSGQGNEVFLHKNESNFQNLKSGDTVNAFLYFDNVGRLAATLKEPYFVVGEQKFLKVVSVVKNLGVFLHLGINKDLLLSKHDLPENLEQWPIVGDSLFVTMIHKGNRLLAKLIDVTSIIKTEALEIDDFYEFNVIKIGDQGLNLYNEDNQLVFVHNTLTRGKYRLGEALEVKIIKETERGYLGTLIAQKEIVRFDDAEVILTVLRKHGKIPLTAKSSSEEVNKYFSLSRKAFKRALGLLYKNNQVIFTENETILLDGDKNE